MNSPVFYGRLIEELAASFYNYFGPDNWDEVRYGTYQRSWKAAILEKINSLLGERVALLPKRVDEKHIGQFILQYGEGLAKSYDLLADEYSRQLFVKVVAYRILGHRKVRLPLNRHDFETGRQQAGAFIKSGEQGSVKNAGCDLDFFDLHEMGYPIKLNLTRNAVFTLFGLKHYEYGKDQAPVKASAGDYVIDGGGCWGDTALYFANEVGEKGKVFVFEFMQNNLGILAQNLSLNPDLARRIQVVKHPLWGTSDVPLSFAGEGPGSFVSPKTAGGKQDAVSLAIDDLVDRNRVEHIDFIKMDIEGAELAALKGAERTIKRFRPKMAISLYHSTEDFIRIPEYLSSLQLGYRFYLDHFTMHAEETVLFVAPEQERSTAYIESKRA